MTKIAFKVHGTEKLPQKERHVLVLLLTGKTLIARRIGEVLWESLMADDLYGQDADYGEFFVSEVFLWAYLDEREYVDG